MTTDRITEITSAQNQRVKAARRLHSARGRRESGQILLEGRRLLSSAIDAGIALTELFVLDADDDLIEDAEHAARVPEAVLRQIATTQHPQGCVGVARWAPESVLPADSRRVLVLAEVSDPGNAGTLIRTGAAFGCDTVALTSGSCDPSNPKVVRASGGAVFATSVVSGLGMDELLAGLAERDIPTLAAVAHVAGPPEAVGDRWALLLGSEAHGLSNAVVRATDRVVSVPMSGDVESLNAAAAGAVLLYILAARS